MAEQRTEPHRPVATDSLLQELLLALLGFFGDVFVDTSSQRSGSDSRGQQQSVPDPSACCVRVAEYVHWIDAPDRCARHVARHVKSHATRQQSSCNAERQPCCASVLGRMAPATYMQAAALRLHVACITPANATALQSCTGRHRAAGLACAHPGGLGGCGAAGSAQQPLGRQPLLQRNCHGHHRWERPLQWCTPCRSCGRRRHESVFCA
jgi:hypothetical protein